MSILGSLIHRWKMRKYDNYNISEYFRLQGAIIGNDCRLLIRSLGSEPWLVEIGDRVTVTSGVSFVTHDGGCHLFRLEVPTLQFLARIKIGNNCFIGINSILMPGVTIGDNCVIGAGSVVTKDISSGSVAVGVPAKVISTTEKYKEKLLAFWKTQKPPGYGESLDPTRISNIKYLNTTLELEKYKLKEHFMKNSPSRSPSGTVGEID